jgi:tRNA threonylcarbamoyladenosine biosynthesis protein TsaE
VIKYVVGEGVEVTSPTFNLVHHYDSDRGDVYHYDLYRIEDKTELLALDIEDAIDHGLVFIEWPELAKDYLAKDYVQLNISIAQDGTRVISISGEGYWEKVEI